MTEPAAPPAPQGIPARIRERARSWRDDPDPRHDERTASLLGLALGVSFLTCALTGLYSHLVQHPPDWFQAPSQPAGLYRVTQGLHVATGIASVPLLLAKLWAVFPHLFRWPPVTGVAHALERISLVPLVGGSLFMLVSGMANIDLWYVLPFNFPPTHFWMAWVTMGALAIHIGAKVTTTRAALARTRPVELGPDPSRRRFLTAVGVGSAGLTAVTIGQTVNPLSPLALLAPRHPDRGTQGFPVNGSAAETGVTTAATDPGFRLLVDGMVTTSLSFSLDDLRALPRRDATLPIACVEGWSASRRWSGVPLRELLARAGAGPDAWVTVHSLQTDGFNRSDINAVQARDPDTLLALEADGEILSLDHGYPVRLIGPNRPGVMQTKWITRVEVH